LRSFAIAARNTAASAAIFLPHAFFRQQQTLEREHRQRLAFEHHARHMLP
jgi:hypothetical protein